MYAKTNLVCPVKIDARQGFIVRDKVHRRKGAFAVFVIVIVAACKCVCITFGKRYAYFRFIRQCTVYRDLLPQWQTNVVCAIARDVHRSRHAHISGPIMAYISRYHIHSAVRIARYLAALHFERTFGYIHAADAVLGTVMTEFAAFHIEITTGRININGAAVICCDVCMLRAAAYSSGCHRKRAYPNDAHTASVAGFVAIYRAAIHFKCAGADIYAAAIAFGIIVGYSAVFHCKRSTAYAHAAAVDFGSVVGYSAAIHCKRSTAYAHAAAVIFCSIAVYCAVFHCKRAGADNYATAITVGSTLSSIARDFAACHCKRAKADIYAAAVGGTVTF